MEGWWVGGAGEEEVGGKRGLALEEGPVQQMQGLVDVQLHVF